MLPKQENKKLKIAFFIIIEILAAWTGMFISLGCKRKYKYMDWIKDMKYIYIKLLKKNMYGLKNPIWFVKYTNEYTGICIFMVMIAVTMGILMMMTNNRKYIRGKEFGTSKFATANQLCKELRSQVTPLEMFKEEDGEIKRLFRKPKPVKYTVNMLDRRLSQNVYISLNTKQTDLNNHVLCVGSSGAGKSFKFLRPLLMQQNGTFICTDPKGELATSMGHFFEDRGYSVKVLNLISSSGMKKSCRYNPFKYIRTDMDVVKLSQNIMQNTSKKDMKGSDPFFEDSAAVLLQALIYYILAEYKNQPEKQNFRTLMELLAMADFQVDPRTGNKVESELDKKFSNLEKNELKRISKEKAAGKIPKPMSEAIVKYNSVMRSAADTARSIIVTLDSHLSNLHVHELLDLLSEDDMNIAELGMGSQLDGKTKTALFLCIPDSDTSFNFVVGMLYTQIFQELFYQADNVCKERGGNLPISVTLCFDEFANVALPDDFEHVLSTMRSRNMAAIIILQNMAQIKAMYEKSWENISGNCDTFIYLGGNEQSTFEYISKLIGKGTFDKRTTGETTGKNGSGSKNYDVVGRELLLPEEVRKLSRKKCFILISGQDPVIDFKTNTVRHPLFKYIDHVVYEYDRNLHVKGGMYIASDACYKYYENLEKIEGVKKILTISAEDLKNISSESIDTYGDDIYQDIQEELFTRALELEKEKEKELPITDEELGNMNKNDLKNVLLLQGEGYSDRQIKSLLSILESSSDYDLNQLVKMFPADLSEERMEMLTEKLLNAED